MEQQYRAADAEIGSVRQEQADFAELGTAQWALIHAFERDYIGKRVYGTRCTYEDDNWFNLDGSTGSRTGIRWSRSSDTTALQILLKATILDYAFARSLEISSAKLLQTRLKKQFFLLLRTRGSWRVRPVRFCSD